MTPFSLFKRDRVIKKTVDQDRLTRRYTRFAVDFIKSTAGAPFFLYFAHMYVHLPLYAPDGMVRASKNGDYGACVAGIDWATDVILKELERQGLDDDTLVIFTSDNGSRLDDQGGSNGPLRGKKG